MTNNATGISAGLANTPGHRRPEILMTREIFEALPETAGDNKPPSSTWRKVMIDGSWCAIDPHGKFSGIGIGVFVSEG